MAIVIVRAFNAFGEEITRVCIELFGTAAHLRAKSHGSNISVTNPSIAERQMNAQDGWLNGTGWLQGSRNYHNDLNICSTLSRRPFNCSSLIAARSPQFQYLSTSAFQPSQHLSISAQLDTRVAAAGRMSNAGAVQRFYRPAFICTPICGIWSQCLLIAFRDRLPLNVLTLFS